MIEAKEYTFKICIVDESNILDAKSIEDKLIGILESGFNNSDFATYTCKIQLVSVRNTNPKEEG